MAGLLDKVDEVVGDADLPANVAELAPHGEEEVDLLFERADIVVANCVFLDAPVMGGGGGECRVSIPILLNSSSGTTGPSQ